MGAIIGALSKVPWAQIGGAAMTIGGATLTAFANKRNQERTIERVSAEVAKKVIENQDKLLRK